MLNREKLIKRFADVGLTLEFTDKPFAIGDGGAMVFGMDIRRRLGPASRNEYFVMYPGAEENVIAVQAYSKDLAQIVLLVNEPEHRWRDVIWSSIKPRVAGGAKVLGVNGDTRNSKERHDGKFKSVVQQGWVVEYKTPKANRYFLLGRDERQMFMCQLPSHASSVKQAHDLLKHGEISTADEKGAKYKRQGEWFFIPASDESQKHIEAMFKAHGKTKAAIGEAAGRRQGKPHTAAMLVVADGKPLAHGFPVLARGEVYVKGTVTHADHATVRFDKWMRVLANRERHESFQRSGGVAGGTWID